MKSVVSIPLHLLYKVSLIYLHYLHPPTPKYRKSSVYAAYRGAL